MARRGARMRKSRYTRRVTTHHVPPPTAYRPITTQTIRRGTHTPTAARDDRPGWRRADTLRRKVRRRRDAPRATRRPSRDGRRRARGISFYIFFARAETRVSTTRADDAVQTCARRSSPDRDRIEIASGGAIVIRRSPRRRARGGFERDARRASDRSTAFVRDAGRVDEGRVDDGPIASAHPSSSIDATAARGRRWLFFLSRERWFGGTKRGMHACVHE